MPVTEADVRQQVRRLSAIYATSKSEEDTVRAWMWVLGDDLTPHELAGAVSGYAKGADRYFPAPGRILQDALSHRSGATNTDGPRDWNQLQEGPCPVCGAVLQLATEPLAQQAVWHHYRNPKTTRWEGKLRKRTKDDPPPPKRYTVVHDAAAHQRAGAPIIGHASYSEARRSA
jgi:hypothetical protein